MERLVKAIEDIRARLDGLRRHSLKETPTRTIVIDPLLGALGWDVRDPDEVQLEYPTVDGKSVDYALNLNGKPVLLVEAKGLEDPLKDVKDVTQVVAYAANAGIAWCILTSGIIWKVYSVKETCQAPDKLMFEVDLDPAREEMPIAELAKKMWRFSRDEMAKGTLDGLGEQVFTDGKVRKALSAIMSDPPRALLNLVRKAVGDSTTSPQRTRESLGRVWREGWVRGEVEPPGKPPPPGPYTVDYQVNYIRDSAARERMVNVLEELKTWAPSAVKVAPLRYALSLKVGRQIFCYLIPRREFFLVRTHNDEGKWTNFPIRKDEDIEEALRAVRATFERFMAAQE